jgi:CRP-like cAMP-binding protein
MNIASRPDPHDEISPARASCGDGPAMSRRQSALEQLRPRLVALAKGRLIYDEQDRPDAFYRVESGCVRLQVNCGDGRRRILAFCLPGDVFGIRLHGAHISAAETTAASVFKRFAMSTITDDALDKESMLELVGMAAEMSSALSVHLRGLSHGSAEARLVWFIDWLALRQGAGLKGGVVRPPMSRRDIADFLGLTPETLSRMFARLRARGHVQIFSDKRWLLRPRPTMRVDAENGLPTAA